MDRMHSQTGDWCFKDGASCDNHILKAQALEIAK